MSGGSPPTNGTFLLLGGSGQVGYELQRALQGLGRIVTPSRAQLDLRDMAAVRAVLRGARPMVVLNAAAYTAVDRAESEPQEAALVNAELPRVLAEEARDLGALMVHYSTDYVFDGSLARAYREDDTPMPLNVYGATKLEGDRAIEEVAPLHLNFRTSWVYGARGQNFLRTMLRLARERDELRIVGDQRGAPTWSRSIAEVTAHVLSRGLAVSGIDRSWWAERSGIYNLCASGETTWAGFASAIFDEFELPKRPTVQVIASADYRSAARRPADSRLNTDKLFHVFGLRVPDWRELLTLCAADVGANPPE